MTAPVSLEEALDSYRDSIITASILHERSSQGGRWIQAAFVRAAARTEEAREAVFQGAYRGKE